MKRNPWFVVFWVLALATMACGIQFNLPVVQVKTGPTVTDDISVAKLETTDGVANVTLAFGAGKIKLGPGAEDALISGTATYNVPDFKPEVKKSGSDIRLEQGNLKIGGIPDFNERIKNEWDLKFGDSPIKLDIQAGGYSADYEFGDLSLQDLKVADGAADVSLSFSKPNRVEMDTFRYSSGASNITFKDLANANFDQMIFQSGAGSYRLDFAGELKRDATVRIETGFSTVTVTVPKGVNAVLEVEGGLSNVDLSGDWKKEGNQYLLAGSGSTLRFIVKMGAGTLRLEN